MQITLGDHGTQPFALLLTVISRTVHFQHSLPGRSEATLWMMIGCELARIRPSPFCYATSLQWPQRHHGSCGYIQASKKADVGWVFNIVFDDASK